MTRYDNTDGDDTKSGRTILVTGATGKQGGVAARRLLHQGWTVRALVRDPGAEAATALARAGADLVQGDLDSPETVTAAVEGAYGIFAISPVAYGPRGWDTELEYARGAALTDAAASAGVEHFVFTSIATIPGHDTPGSAGKRRIEERIEASGMRWTHLRPVRFMENYLLTTPLVEGVRLIDGLRDGVHRHLFRPDHGMQVIAVEDIAVFASLAFDDPDRFAGRALELAEMNSPRWRPPPRSPRPPASRSATSRSVRRKRRLWARSSRWSGRSSTAEAHGWRTCPPSASSTRPFAPSTPG